MEQHMDVSDRSAAPNTDPDRSLALLEGLLGAYSPTGEESGATAYLVNAMRSLGYSAYLDGIGNPVGEIGDGPNEILLLGHIDTVPGYIEVQKEDDRLYGRGAVDAKGPLACFVAAGAQARLPHGWKVTVIGALGEEGDSRGARYLRDNRRRACMVVIGEPSGWDRVCLGYKGSYWFTYTLRQELAHTAARTGSACEAAVEFWNRLSAAAAEFNLPHTKYFEQLTPSLRGMSSSLDGFIDAAELKINVRLPEALGPDGLAEIIEGLRGEGEIVVEDSIPAYRCDKNTVAVRAMLAGIRKAGGQPGFTLKTGTSDMNIIGPAWGAPMAAYGPGDSNLDHTPREHILIPEYLRGVQVLAHALERMAAG
jgi:LysW-gamma-L-lysine carboxypeptidase